MNQRQLELQKKMPIARAMAITGAGDQSDVEALKRQLDEVVTEYNDIINAKGESITLHDKQKKLTYQQNPLGDDQTEQQKKAYAEFERNLTELQATELQKRLLAVDKWTESERHLLVSAGASQEDIEKKMVAVTQAAEEQKAKIRTEFSDKAREDAAKAQFSKVDVQESEKAIGPNEALKQRIDLTKELLGAQEQTLAHIDKGKDTSAWQAQQAAIDATKKSLAELNQAFEQLPFKDKTAAIKGQLSTVDTAEAENTIGKTEAIQQRIDLNRELLTIQQQQLATIDQGKDTSAWLAQQQAINQTRQDIVALIKSMTAYQSATQESAIKQKISSVDIKEQNHDIDPTEAVKEKRQLYGELLSVQEQTLGNLDKEKDASAWYAQQDAIDVSA